MLGGLEAIGAHGAGLGEALVEQGGGLAHAFLHAAGRAADALADALDRQGGEWVEEAGDQAELPVHPEHGGDEADDRHRVGERVDGADQGFADDRGVGGEAGGELGGRLAFDAGDVGVEQVAEHAGLQAADDEQDELLDGGGLPVLGGGLAGGDGDHQGRHLVEDTRVVSGEHVERAADHQRVESGQAGHDDRQEKDGEEAAAVEGDLLAPKAAKRCPGGSVGRREGRVHVGRLSGRRSGAKQGGTAGRTPAAEISIGSTPNERDDGGTAVEEVSLSCAVQRV